MNKYMTFCSCILLIALGTLTVYAQSVSGTTTDENTIRQLIEKHAASARIDDVDGMVSTMHDDAVTRLDDGRFLVGRAANAVFCKKSSPGGPIVCHTVIQLNQSGYAFYHRMWRLLMWPLLQCQVSGHKRLISSYSPRSTESGAWLKSAMARASNEAAGGFGGQ